MLCEKIEKIIMENILYVLILVVMEDALRVCHSLNTYDIIKPVLILVVMEDALRDY